MRVSLGIQRPFRYTLAVGAVLLALGLTWGLSPAVIGLTPLFFAAVILSAWYGGLGPGLVATVLAGCATAYVFAEPPFSFNMGYDDLVREIVFIAVAVLVSYLQASTRCAQAELQQAIVKADAANAAKDRFLAVLSHELRNPLNPVLSAACLYERDPTLPSTVRDDFAMIRRNIELEARLIDDLLDLNRISSGKLAMQLETLDVHEVLRDAVRICRDAMAERKLRMVWDLSAHHTTVSGDAARLRQVFWNLLKNAVKFTPAGGAITLRSVDSPGGNIEISVHDSGIGIDPRVLPRIFNPFDQGDVSITREFGGLGLGLSISKMLIEAHGGTILAHSDGRGKGATFTVNMPTCVAAASPGAAAPTASLAKPHRAVRILLVEDHEDTARAMSKLLRASKHNVSTAGTVGDALEAALHGEFDLVIADLGLPDGSGLDLMRQLKQFHNLRGIALTGYGMTDDIVQSREAGFEEHLTKPVDLVKLESTIQRVAVTSSV